MANVVVFLNSSSVSPWTVPSNFGSLVSVECVGPGGNCFESGTGNFRSGGGGGAYAKITSTSTTLTPGVTTINFIVPATGVAAQGTVWNATTLALAVTAGNTVACAAASGHAGASGSGGTGGLSSASVGTTVTSGGTASGGAAGNAGGGAAGPNGVGGNASGNTGGTGDGGTVPAGGNSGTEWTTSGCGSGGTGTTGAFNSGGKYGGGAGGAGSGSSGGGTSGLIVITYVSTSPVTPYIFDNPSILAFFPIDGYTWFNPAIQTTVIVQPFIPNDFSNPNLPYKIQDFNYSNLNPFLAIYPKGLNWDQPNPTLAKNVYINLGHTQSGPLYGKPVFNYDYPNPTLGKEDNRVNRTWTQSGPLYGTPFYQTDQPNPVLSVLRDIALLSGQGNSPQFMPPVYPKGLNWDQPNPTLGQIPDRDLLSWLQAYGLYLPAPPRPAFNYDQPNPVLSASRDIVLLSGQGYTPPSIYPQGLNWDFPNPTLGRIPNIDLLSWLQTYGPYLPAIKPPVSNYDQPNPSIPISYINREFNPPAWASFIPPPLPPVVPTGGGRYITEQEVQDSIRKTWRYKEDINSLYRHIAAVSLGRKGGNARK